MQDATTCFHCQATLGHTPVDALIGGENRHFCCRGCAGAAQWIVAEGLDDYYRLRRNEGGKVDEAATEGVSRTLSAPGEREWATRLAFGEVGEHGTVVSVRSVFDLTKAS